MLEAPRLRTLLGVALASACGLGFQVILTRLLSAVLAYHFSFLAISLALLGIGAGSLFVYVRAAHFDAAPLRRSLARWTAAYGFFLVLIPFGLVRLNLDDANGVTFRFSANLAAACVLAAIPCFVLGVVIALAIRGYTRHVGRVYAYDLIGAGLGALVVVPLLRWPAPELIVVLGIAAAVAAFLFAEDLPREMLGSGAVAGLAVLVLVAAELTSVLYLPTRYTPAKGTHRVADKWSALSRVQGYVGTPRDSAMFYDRVFAPVLGPVNGKIPDWKDLVEGAQSIPYELVKKDRGLVIGGGGGRDIYLALSSGMRNVDVIELNKTIEHVVDQDMGSVSGHPYTRPGVHTSIGDGRSILAARSTKYDEINMGFTDTLSANSAQGFALSEANLYTVEAFEDYFDHLKPDGILAVSRLDRLVGDESIRATVLMLASLEHYGIQHPERNMVVIRGRDFFNATYGTILAKLTPFTPQELATIRTLANERGLGVAYVAGGPYQDAWGQLAKAGSWKNFCTSYPLNVCPPTDDKPFFFNMTWLSKVTQGRPHSDVPGRYLNAVDPTKLLMLSLGVLLVLSVIGLILPLAFVRNVRRPSFNSLYYFAAIGLGFLILEIVLIQRFVLFLGFPTYALSVVLFSLLIFTGVGSYLSTRLGGGKRVLIPALVVAVVLIAVSAGVLQPLLRNLIQLPFPARVAVSIAILAPFGIVLGMPMPIGLQRLHAMYPDGVPWAWGVNGIASVLASVLGVAIAVFFGYRVVTLIAAACYLFALVHALVGEWPEVEDVGEFHSADIEVAAL
jgi:hypothetical protein